MTDDLLDQLDDDLDNSKEHEQADYLDVDQQDDECFDQEDFVDSEEGQQDRLPGDIDSILDEHQIPEAHQPSMDRLDQLIDQEKSQIKDAKKNKPKALIAIILVIVTILLSLYFILLKPSNNPKHSDHQSKTEIPAVMNSAEIQAAAQEVSKSKLIRAAVPNQLQAPNQLQSTSLSDLASIQTRAVSSGKVNPGPNTRQTITDRAVQNALGFDPNEDAAINQQQQAQKKWLKLKAINEQLNNQLRQKEKQLAEQQRQLQSYQNELKQVSDQAAIAGRTRIGGLQIIDFAAAGRVAVVSSQYSKSNQIIALTQGEVLKLGNSSYKVEKVNAMDSRVIIGKYYYIDQSLVSQPILGVAKKSRNHHKKIKNKLAEKSLKPIRNWTILFASQSGDYSVIASKDNRAKRLSRGDRLSPYGIVKNILRDGSIVFKNHIIQYQSTTK